MLVLKRPNSSILPHHLTKVYSNVYMFIFPVLIDYGGKKKKIHIIHHTSNIPKSQALKPNIYFVS